MLWLNKGRSFWEDWWILNTYTYLNFICKQEKKKQIQLKYMKCD